MNEFGAQMVFLPVYIILGTENYEKETLFLYLHPLKVILRVPYNSEVLNKAKHFTCQMERFGNGGEGFVVPWQHPSQYRTFASHSWSFSHFQSFDPLLSVYHSSISVFSLCMIKNAKIKSLQPVE